MTAARLNFTREEFAQRIQRTREAMEKAGIEMLIISDPSNMNWLTGYDGWSSYVPQCVVLPIDKDPIWYGRKMDVPGAKLTTWLPDSQIHYYPESFIFSGVRHPYDHLTGVLQGLGYDRAATIGVEMDNYFYSANQDNLLRTALGPDRFRDATGLVNWLRGVKSAQEIEYMRIAGRIVSKAHERMYEVCAPGVRKNEVAAELFHALTEGVDGYAGDYSAFMPIIPSGADCTAPHLTWDDKPMQKGEGTYFEFAGTYKRYHVPLCRTIFLGKPTQEFIDAEKATLEGMDIALDFVKPGNTCHDVATAWVGVLAKYGIEKTSRSGYAVGVSYPPDWGERTMSIRPGDMTVLQPGMTFHFMTGLWLKDMGFECTETLLVTETGYELLGNVPRKLFVKDC